MIRHILLSILANGAAIYSLTYIFGEKVSLQGGIKAFILAGLIFGILNVLVKPLLKLVSLPFVILSAGIFLFVINALMLWLLKFTLDVLAFDGVALIITGGILTYLLASIVLAVVNSILHWLVKK